MRLRELILEGGNIFKDKSGEALTRPISREELMPTISWLERITKMPLRDNLIGSTGKKAVSNDVDIAVDQDLTSKDDLADRLRGWAESKGLDARDYVRKSGISVHFKTPIKGDPKHGHAQTDFMFYKDIDFAKWMAKYDPSTAFKNADRIILMNSIAKSLGLKLTPDEGVTTRDTGRPISKDPAEIARIFLGPDATEDDLSSVEKIMRYEQRDPDRDSKIADARDNFASRGLNLDRAAG